MSGFSRTARTADLAHALPSTGRLVHCLSYEVVLAAVRQSVRRCASSRAQPPCCMQQRG
jgi:hypothetical protein